MYTSKDEYFYFRPRSECSGNILPVRVADAESDPSAPLRPLSYEDVLAFYEIAVTKIGLFRWAEDGFSSAAGIRGESTYVAANGLGFPFPDPESGLDLGDMGEFPPYVPPRRVLLPDEPAQVASGSASDLDPFGPAFGDPGLSEGLVGMLSLLRDVALCGPYPPYSVSSPRRFAWDDVEFDFTPESESYDDPSERIDVGGGVRTDPESHVRAYRAPFPAHAVPGSATDALWSSGPVERTEEGYAEWFCDVFETGAWIRARSEESGLSLLEELRALPYRQGLLKRAWLDLLYFDSVAVRIEPRSRYVSSSYSALYESGGEWTDPEFYVAAEDIGGPGDPVQGYEATVTLAGSFGLSDVASAPVVSESPPAESSAEGGVSWLFSEYWSGSRSVVAVAVPEYVRYRLDYSGSVTPVESSESRGLVYSCLVSESWLGSASARAPVGGSRGAFEVALPAFPSGQVPFDPGLVDDVRGHVTCSWYGYRTHRSAYGGYGSGRRSVDVPADPLSGDAFATLDGTEAPVPSDPGDPGRYVSWGCGWESGPADVELDLGEDGSEPVLRVSSGALSSAMSSAESAAGASLRMTGAVSGLSVGDPSGLLPSPVDGFGRDSPEPAYAHSASDSGSGIGSSSAGGLNWFAWAWGECYGGGPSYADSDYFRYIWDAVRRVDSSNPSYSASYAPGDAEYSSGVGTAESMGGGSSVLAEVKVNCLWLFVRFRPRCVTDVALDALRDLVDSEDSE